MTQMHRPIHVLRVILFHSLSRPLWCLARRCGVLNTNGRRDRRVVQMERRQGEECATKASRTLLQRWWGKTTSRDTSAYVRALVSHTYGHAFTVRNVDTVKVQWSADWLSLRGSLFRGIIVNRMTEALGHRPEGHTRSIGNLTKPHCLIC